MAGSHSGPRRCTGESRPERRSSEKRTGQCRSNGELRAPACVEGVCSYRTGTDGADSTVSAALVRCPVRIRRTSDRRPFRIMGVGFAGVGFGGCLMWRNSIRRSRVVRTGRKQTWRAKTPVRSGDNTYRRPETVHRIQGDGVTGTADRGPEQVHGSSPSEHARGIRIRRSGPEHVPSRSPPVRDGEQTRQRKTAYDIARPETDEPTEETGELVNLIVEEHGYGIHMNIPRARKISIRIRRPAPASIFTPPSSEGPRHAGRTPRCGRVSGPSVRIKDERLREVIPEPVDDTADVIGVNVSCC